VNKRSCVVTEIFHGMIPFVVLIYKEGEKNVINGSALAKGR
jgi:hypothetical protein